MGQVLVLQLTRSWLSAIHFVCAFLFCGSAFSQTTMVVPQLRQTTALLADRQGFVWAAGAQGVHRWDGTTLISPFTKTERLKSGAHRLFEDRKGNIFVATGSGSLGEPERGNGYFIDQRVGPAGLLRINADGNQTLIADSNEASHWLWAFVEDKNGTVWAGGEEGLWRIEGTKATHVPLQDKSRDAGIVGLWISEQGDLWAARANGLVRIDLTNFATHAGPTLEAMKDIVAMPNGQAAVATRDAIYTFDGHTLTLVSRYAEPRKLAVQANGRIWAWGWDGLLTFDKGETFRINEAAKLTPSATLTIDNTGSLWWVGGDSVFRTKPEAWISKALPFDGSALAVLAARDHSVWVSHSQGVTHWQPNGTHTTLSLDQTKGFVYAMAEDHSGGIFLAGTGMQRWRDGALENLPSRPEWTSTIREVGVGHDGSVWMAGTHLGVWKYDDNTLARPSLALTEKEGLCPGRATFVYGGPTGTMWFGSRAGLSQWQNGKLRCITSLQGLPANDVTSVLEDADGTVWITMIGLSGLARMRNGIIEDLGQRISGASGGFFGVADDGQGKLWFSSSQGVWGISRRELEQTPTWLAFANLTIAQGLPSDACSLAAHPPLASPSPGNLWVPTNHGVALVLTNLVRRNEAFKASITQVETSGVRTAVTSAVHVFPTPNKLEIWFSAPEFDLPSSSILQMQLKGIDAGWQTADARAVASYTNLPPGSYTFAVRALRPGLGADAAADAEIRVLVAAHFYETWTWRIAVALILIAAGAAVVERRRRRDRLEATHINDERTRIARELHDSLAQIFMGLGFQLDALKAGKPDPALNDKLESLRGMVDEASTEVHRAVWSLRAAVDVGSLEHNLQSVIQRSKRNLGLRVEFSVKGRLANLGAIEHEAPKILEECLTNAAKHGHATVVSVLARLDSDGFTLQVVDQGTRAKVEPKTRTEGGFGLIGMRERASQCGGTLNAGPSPQGTGFEVTFHVPLHHIQFNQREHKDQH